jgi:hypothetical protein
LLENIITGIEEYIPKYGGFKDYNASSASADQASHHEAELDLKASELDDIVYQHPYSYSTFYDHETKLEIPDYFTLTEKIRASFQPSYSNYPQDVMNKRIVYVNMPEVKAYGWVNPSDPETPIVINVAYANTEEQIYDTTIHEMIHEQTLTYHEPRMMHEFRVRLTSDTSYLG